MLDYVYNYDELVARFVAMLIPHCRRGFGRCKTIGVIDDAGQLIAGLVYHNYDPEAGIIEISGAALPGSRCRRAGDSQRGVWVGGYHPSGLLKECMGGSMPRSKRLSSSNGVSHVQWPASFPPWRRGM